MIKSWNMVKSPVTICHNSNFLNIHSKQTKIKKRLIKPTTLNYQLKPPTKTTDRKLHPFNHDAAGKLVAGKSCQKTDLRQYAKYNPNGRKLIIIARRHMDTGMKEFKNRWIDREVSMDGIMAPSISSWKGLLYHDLDRGMLRLQNPGIASYFQ